MSGRSSAAREDRRKDDAAAGRPVQPVHARDGGNALSPNLYSVSWTTPPSKYCSAPLPKTSYPAESGKCLMGNLPTVLLPDEHVMPLIRSPLPGHVHRPSTMFVISDASSVTDSPSPSRLIITATTVRSGRSMYRFVVTPCCTPPCHARPGMRGLSATPQPLDTPAQTVEGVNLVARGLHGGHLPEALRLQERPCLKCQSETHHVTGGGEPPAARNLVTGIHETRISQGTGIGSCYPADCSARWHADRPAATAPFRLV